jgi:hypothetical protein
MFLRRSIRRPIAENRNLNTHRRDDLKCLKCESSVNTVLQVYIYSFYWCWTVIRLLLLLVEGIVDTTAKTGSTTQGLVLDKNNTSECHGDFALGMCSINSARRILNIPDMWLRNSWFLLCFIITTSSLCITPCWLLDKEQQRGKTVNCTWHN